MTIWLEYAFIPHRDMPEQENVNSPERVGFPQQPPIGEKKKKGGLLKWIIAILGVVLILGIGGFFIMGALNSDDTSNEDEPSLSSLERVETPEPAPTEEPTPEPTTEPEDVDKAEIVISILNGTGTPGDAGYLQDLLEAEGYETITTGNNDTQEETVTTVTFSRDLAKSIKDEITNLLEDTYEEVTVKERTFSNDTEIEIVTGPKS